MILKVRYISVNFIKFTQIIFFCKAKFLKENTSLFMTMPSIFIKNNYIEKNIDSINIF